MRQTVPRLWRAVNFLKGKKYTIVGALEILNWNLEKYIGIVGEYGQGPMYISYLLGGRIDFGDLRLFCNDYELSQKDLQEISWNLEPSKEKYRNARGIKP